MSWPLALIFPFLLVSCGGLNLFTDAQESARDKKVASLALERLLLSEESTFEQDVDERILSLHRYYVLVQKNLLRLEQNLDGPRWSFSHDSSYLSLLALRSQVESLEQELLELYQSSEGTERGRKAFMREKIHSFSLRGQMEALSVRNILARLGHPQASPDADADPAQIAAAYRQLLKAPEFQIYEKNIEHLSQVLEVGAKGRAPAASGLVHQWPAKVWALAFLMHKGEQLPENLTEHLKRMGSSASVYRSTEETALGALAQAKDAGMALISTVDTLDWAPQTADRIIKRTRLMLRKAHRGAGVLLFHGTHARSSTAATVITREISQGPGRICALDQIVKDLKQGHNTVCSKN